MSNETTALKFTRDEIERDLIAILTDMTADWDLSFTGGVQPETRLMAHLHFEKLLMVDGRYVQELQVKEIADFLVEQLAE
jgi:acyl carrier protein